MKCPNKYAELPCSVSGVGYLHSKTGLHTQELWMIKGHASQFPSLQDGEFFFAYIHDNCNKTCLKVRVTFVDKINDVLTIDAPLSVCFSSQSRVSYDHSSVERTREIAASVGINVVPPLVYDCETRTLSIDCAGLREMITNCGA